MDELIGAGRWEIRSSDNSKEEGEFYLAPKSSLIELQKHFVDKHSFSQLLEVLNSGSKNDKRVSWTVEIEGNGVNSVYDRVDNP
ncbi:hypothetical protein BVRB_8g183970 [Beta vulgaris subsp. vulgaris]|nr:hypothetical protein BVRB_8g183970 [Beta vulgaris subsp. vulgaris]